MKISNIKLEIICSKCKYFDENNRTLCGQGRRCIVMCKTDDGTITLPDCHTDKYNNFKDGIISS